MDQKSIIDSGTVLAGLADRILYLIDVKGNGEWGQLNEMYEHVTRLRQSIFELNWGELFKEIDLLEEKLLFLEERAAKALTPAETVNIVRSVQRFTMQDILENVYDTYSELGGDIDINIDPAVVAARATISRRVKKKIYRHQVMVIGHEKGRGEEFRNGGCAKPWGNEKALKYMRVAETEGIPIHFLIFTPGSYPIEDFPGAAQQIARNIYTMAKLKVPMISFISEGGSGGAEAIGLADVRLMAARGYYSVISPEGGAAIEGRIREGEKLPKELVNRCALNLRLTAEDNLRIGTVDRVVPEPPLGAKREEYTFFKRLRYELIKATDETVLRTKSFRPFRAYALRQHAKNEDSSPEEFNFFVGWELTQREKEKLLHLRSKKYRRLGRQFKNNSTNLPGFEQISKFLSKIYYETRYGLLRSQSRNVQKVIEEVSSESSILLRKVTEPVRVAYDIVFPEPEKIEVKSGAVEDMSGSIFAREWENYTSPLANEDRTVTCPNAETHGCMDLWVPDLYGEFSGVCPTCGHHFPLEYQWYLRRLFDRGSVNEFNAHIVSANPLNFEGFDARLQNAINRTKRQSAIITCDASVMGTKLVVAMLYSDFRSGTVGCAEGEKFIQACDRAAMKRRPFLAYIHTTGGIRIQEGTLGVVQMPRCTMAVREYIDGGGLYIVVYDNNSYAGPVASFLGCSPYQYGIRSSRIGFAGPRVIRETTGQDVHPDYHKARNALRRGHIQGIWDRRDFRKNLHEALLTMGGPHLYYK